MRWIWHSTASSSRGLRPRQAATDSARRPMLRSGPRTVKPAEATGQRIDQVDQLDHGSAPHDPHRSHGPLPPPQHQPSPVPADPPPPSAHASGSVTRPVVEVGPPLGDGPPRGEPLLSARSDGHQQVHDRGQLVPPALTSLPRHLRRAASSGRASSAGRTPATEQGRRWRPHPAPSPRGRARASSRRRPAPAGPRAVRASGQRSRSSSSISSRLREREAAQQQARRLGRPSR